MKKKLIKPFNRFSNLDYFLGIAFCLIISILYLFRFNSTFTNILSLILFTIYFFRIKFKFSSAEAHIICMILTLPFSFISIIGESYFSLFIFLQISFIISLFTSNFFSKKNQFLKFLGVLLILFSIIVYLLSQTNYFELHVETFIKTILFLSVLVIALLKFRTSLKLINSIKIFYIFSGVINGFMVLIQYLLFKYLGFFEVGFQNQIGELRMGFAGLFYDYSISSIYLSTVAIVLIYDLFTRKNTFGISVSIILILFSILTSILTSARSGIAALLITIFFLIIYLRNIRLLIIMSILSIPVVQLILYLFTLNRASNISNDSGRIENFSNSIDFFYNNFWFGSRFLGFNETTKRMLPHNFVLDFLVQYGILFTLFMLIFLGLIIHKGLKTKPELFFLTLLMLIGGSFHASLINTHYIIIPLLLIIGLNNSNENLSYHQ